MVCSPSFSRRAAGLKMLCVGLGPHRRPFEDNGLMLHPRVANYFRSAGRFSCTIIGRGAALEEVFPEKQDPEAHCGSTGTRTQNQRLKRAIFSVCNLLIESNLEVSPLLLLSTIRFPSRIPTSKDHFGRKDFLPVEPQSGLSFLFRLSEPRFA